MEWLIPWATEHAQYAHYAFFGLLMLAGFNVPISEDLVLIAGGMLASTVVPENTYLIFIWIFLGAYLSDWVAYYIGRRIGPRLWQSRWFRGSATPERLQMIENFYACYGARTLLIGRFIPFGVRNCLFMTAGMGRMPFGKFILADGIACIISNSVLFSLAYSFGRNYEVLFEEMRLFNALVFTLFLVALTVGLLLWWRKGRKSSGVV